MSESAADPAADAEIERAAWLARLECLLGHEGMNITDGQVRVRVSLATYLDHLSDEELATLARNIARTAGIMVRACARLDSLQFAQWCSGNLPHELGPIDEMGAEFAIVRDGVQRPLDDLASKAPDETPPVVAAGGNAGGEALEQLLGRLLKSVPLLNGVALSGSVHVHFGDPRPSDPVLLGDTLLQRAAAVHETSPGGVA